MQSGRQQMAVQFGVMAQWCRAGARHRRRTVGLYFPQCRATWHGVARASGLKAGLFAVHLALTSARRTFRNRACNPTQSENTVGTLLEQFFRWGTPPLRVDQLCTAAIHALCLRINRTCIHHGLLRLRNWRTNAADAI
jgi:hypothetical protein